MITNGLCCPSCCQLLRKPNSSFCSICDKQLDRRISKARQNGDRITMTRARYSLVLANEMTEVIRKDLPIARRLFECFSSAEKAADAFFAAKKRYVVPKEEFKRKVNELFAAKISNNKDNENRKMTIAEVFELVNHGEQKLADLKALIEGGEKALEEGEKALEEGEKALEEGEKDVAA